MKKQFWIYLIIAIVSVSCQKENFYDEDFSNDGIENFDDDNGNSGNDDDFDFDDDENDTGNNDDDNQGNDDGHNHDGEEGSLTLYKVTGDDISKIKDFDVPESLKPFQQDYAKHIQMWEFTARLIPIEYRDKIAEFEVFHGGGQLLGYVAPVDENDLSKWKFALGIDSAEELETIDFKDMFTYTTLHEYGHVLTLNDEQVEVMNESNCGTYFTGEGCSKANSYINRLVELGWADILDEAKGADPYEIYEKYQDRFLTDYAATNPGEDIAEVFTWFITLEDKPAATTMANKKVRLLYEFPELVEMRSRIRQNETVQALRAGSWLTNPLQKRFRVGKHKSCVK